MQRNDPELKRSSYHLAKVPCLITAFCLCLSAVVWLGSENANWRRDELRLANISEQITSSLRNQVNLFTYGLGGANGIFAASKSVEHDEFKAYVASRDVAKEFPGALGFGYISYVPRGDVGSFLARVRADNQAEFGIKNSGAESDLFVITFLEPEAPYRETIGYNIGADPMLRIAAERAMSTGKPVLTQRLHLLHSSGQDGFLYLRPVYRNGATIDTAADRKAAIAGWVYVPFTINTVAESALRNLSQDVAVTIYEGSIPAAKNILYRNTSLIPTDGLDAVQSYVEIGQQQWRVEVAPLHSFFTHNTAHYLPLAIACIGALISLLAGLTSWMYLAARERAFAARIKAESDLTQGILDSANFMIIATDPAGTIKVFNRAASRMLGYSPQEVIGKASPALIHDPEEVVARAVEVSQRLRRNVAPGFEVFVAAARDNFVDENEWTYVRKNKSRFPVLLSVTSMRDLQGNITGFLSIAHDITERKAGEMALQESEERLRNCFAYAAHGMAIVALDGRWLKVNKALSEMLGRSEAELFEITFQDITHPDDLAGDLELVRQLLMRERDSYHLEKRYIHADGHLVWALLSVSLVQDGYGVPLHFVAQVQDITARKLVEEQLRQRTDELALALSAAERASEVKSQFLTNMSHEIRTPLTSIIGYSESILADRMSDEERHQALSTILRNGRHLLSVINDILDLAKIEAGKMEVEIIPITLLDLISDVCTLMRPRSNEKGISFEVEYRYPLPRIIRSDSTRLKQVLVNLISNAIKFTEKGGVKIVLSYNGESGQMQFDIGDTGVGLSAEQRGKLFKAFSQADTSTTRKFGGTGLGLVISAELVKRLGGEIVVESELGKGSVFTFTIHAGVIPGEALTTALPDATRSGAITLRSAEVADIVGTVLVAEDGKDNQALIALLLRKTNVKVTIVENGSLAVREALSQPFDIILMDMQMPVMDGYEATTLLRQKGYKKPIIAITANAMTKDVERCLQAGCSGHLSKPFQRGDFYTTVRNSLTQSQRETSMAETTLFFLEDNDPELLEIAISFTENLPMRWQDLVAAYGRGDWPAVSQLIHSLRGSSFACPSLALACQELELAAEGGDEVEIEKRWNECASIVKAIGERKHELESLRV